MSALSKYLKRLLLYPKTLQILSGYYTVLNLAKHGAHVYMCSRSDTKGNKAIADITELNPKAHISLLKMDHMSLKSVVDAARQFVSKESALHGLINNAGIMATPFEMSKDGHEAQWQTNYLAHWLFTSQLLPLMLSTSKALPAGSVRIVNLTSSGHFMAPGQGINFEDTALLKKSSQRYGQSVSTCCGTILLSLTLSTRNWPMFYTARL